MVRLAWARTREVILSDILKFACAAGDTERTMLPRNVPQLTALPIVPIFGLEFGSTLAFAVVSDTIFPWPGGGKLIISSISPLDRPVMAVCLMRGALRGWRHCRSSV